MLLLILGCSLHYGTPYAPAEHAPPPALASSFLERDPAELFEEAIARREAGDVEGAVQRLVHLRLSGDSSPAILYQLGVSYELAEDFPTALSVYDLLLSSDRDPGVQRDAGFRRAQVLETLGRYDEALRQLKAIVPPPEGFDFRDRQTYDIQLGVAMLRAGSARRGEALIRGGLSALEGSEATYIRAKGWYALASHTLSEAATLPLDGRERRVQNNVEARGLALLEAEEILSEQVIPLAEPEWILAGVLDLGDAYAALARDIAASPPPPRLSPEQARIYREEIDERAQVLYRKAWARYDMGLTYAGRLGLNNRYTRLLTERRDGLF